MTDLWDDMVRQAARLMAEQLDRDIVAHYVAENQQDNDPLVDRARAYELIQEASRVYYFVSEALPPTGKDGKAILFYQECEGERVWLMHPDRQEWFEQKARSDGLRPVEYDYRGFCDRQVRRSALGRTRLNILQRFGPKVLNTLRLRKIEDAKSTN